MRNKDPNSFRVVLREHLGNLRGTALALGMSLRQAIRRARKLRVKVDLKELEFKELEAA